MYGITQFFSSLPIQSHTELHDSPDGSGGLYSHGFWISENIKILLKYASGSYRRSNALYSIMLF